MHDLKLHLKLDLDSHQNTQKHDLNHHIQSVLFIKTKITITWSEWILFLEEF